MVFIALEAQCNEMLRRTTGCQGKAQPVTPSKALLSAAQHLLGQVGVVPGSDCLTHLSFPHWKHVFVLVVQ